MKEISVGSVGQSHAAIDMLQAIQEEELAKEEKVVKPPKPLPPETQSILDNEIYVPYQCAIDSILDNTFDQQPLVVQALQGWMAEAFRRYAQKHKQYFRVVHDCAVKLHLKDSGKSFGQISPKEHRPNDNHVFKTLVKLKQLPPPVTRGEFEYYPLDKFSIRIKKEFFYPAIEDSLPGLMTYLKRNKIKLLLGNDFVFALPVALREHPEFKEAWDLMEVSHTDCEGNQILKATALHQFKFI